MDRASIEYTHVSPLVLYKLRLEASADVGRQKGGTTSDDRVLIDSHSPHTELYHLRILLAGPSCVTQMDGLLRRSLFVHMGKLPGATLLDICYVCVDLRIIS